MSNIVTGESVEYLPNEHYYGGKPKLDKLVFKSVPSASIVEAMKAKQYDMHYQCQQIRIQHTKILKGIKS